MHAFEEGGGGDLRDTCDGMVWGLLQGYAAGYTLGYCRDKGSGVGSVSDAQCMIQLTNYIIRIIIFQ